MHYVITTYNLKIKKGKHTIYSCDRCPLFELSLYPDILDICSLSLEYNKEKFLELKPLLVYPNSFQEFLNLQEELGRYVKFKTIEEIQQTETYKSAIKKCNGTAT